MTSDAKVGLLLGLVFIFIIAFIINGLPSFREDRKNSELTTNMAGSQNNPPGIGTKERKVISQTRHTEEQPPIVQPSAPDNQNIRFETPLPRSLLVAEETVGDRPAAPVQPLPTAERKENRKVEPSKPALPKVYIVSEGDNLAGIAKKFYGPQAGNKRINITRIFEANRKLLESPDEIYEGQKILIPPLPASAPDKNKVDSVFSTTKFVKVKSTGQRHHSGNGRKAKQNRQYVVREGDSLWRIAAEQLRDGSRYDEIARLNADILDDEDSLSVGMRLKLPAR